jgi:hypothetical protein
MDLAGEIVFRDFSLNREDLPGTVPDGCLLDGFDLSDVSMELFSQKLMWSDGMEIGPPFRRERRIRMAGTIYGSSRTRLFWYVRRLLHIFDPSHNPTDLPNVKPDDWDGHWPLFFSVPTDNPDYPGGRIDLVIHAMPRAVSIGAIRDMIGGDDVVSLAIPWQGSLVSKTGGIIGQSSESIPFAVGAGGTSSGFIRNRGTYFVPADVLFMIGPGEGTVGGSIGFAAFPGGPPGRVSFEIRVAASANRRNVRVYGDKRIVTLQEIDSGTGAVVVPERLAAGMFRTSSRTTWPIIAPGTGSSYSVTATGVSVLVGSEITFREQYA